MPYLVAKVRQFTQIKVDNAKQEMPPKHLWRNKENASPRNDNKYLVLMEFNQSISTKTKA